MAKNRDNGVSPDSLSSIIGRDARFEGKLELNGSIRIDGHFKGTLTSKGSVTIGQNSEVRGNILADEIILGGTLHGNMVAKTRLVLEGSAKVTGDLATGMLVVGEGAQFNGQSGMGTTAVDELSKRLVSTLVSSFNTVKSPQKSDGIVLFEDDSVDETNRSKTKSQAARQSS
ncbi:polymer-forming cytoskeletal protein [bacterium]|nr:polymer-forming cytoskeletal protein [bacterium]